MRSEKFGRDKAGASLLSLLSLLPPLDESGLIFIVYLLSSGKPGRVRFNLSIPGRVRL